MEENEKRKRNKNGRWEVRSTNDSEYGEEWNVLLDDDLVKLRSIVILDHTR